MLLQTELFHAKLDVFQLLLKTFDLVLHLIVRVCVSSCIWPHTCADTGTSHCYPATTL